MEPVVCLSWSLLDVLGITLSDGLKEQLDKVMKKNPLRTLRCKDISVNQKATRSLKLDERGGGKIITNRPCSYIFLKYL